jgi:hypothetical protein
MVFPFCLLLIANQYNYYLFKCQEMFYPLIFYAVPKFDLSGYAIAGLIGCLQLFERVKVSGCFGLAGYPLSKWPVLHVNGSH